MARAQNLHPGTQRRWFAVAVLAAALGLSFAAGAKNAATEKPPRARPAADAKGARGQLAAAVTASHAPTDLRNIATRAQPATATRPDGMFSSAARP
jgi:hypothetical protein